MANEKTIVIPDIGTDDQVDVIEVLVSVGETIEIDDPVITLESEKASMDVPASHAGKVKSITVAVGDKVSEGDAILVLDVEAADDAISSDDASDTAKPQAQKSADTTKQTTKPQATDDVKPAQQTSAPTKSQIETVKLPDVGDFDKVEVIEIAVKVGDVVEEEDPLITLESDKATMDIPAPHKGRVTEVNVKVGDHIAEGDEILSIEVVSASSSPAPEQLPVKDDTAKDKTPTKPSKTVSATNQPASKSFSGVHAGPAVRRFARVLGVDLTRVKDSGPRGRILKEDVESYVKETLSHKQAPAAVGFQLPEMPTIDFSKYGEIETKPLNKIKRITATNMSRNWITVPHVTQFDEADITELEKFRKSQKASADEKGVKLTMVAFLMKAVVGALKKHPEFNTSLDATGENLVYKKYHHIGIAVDTPNGLVVPVIRNVDKKGLFECAKELGEISQKARDKGLTPKEMQGSCFTISSLGGVGGTAFTPIVNAPDVAILGVSRASLKPIYKNDTFVPRLMLPLSLSYDHRVIDGAQAARFTTTLGTLLGDIRKLLL